MCITVGMSKKTISTVEELFRVVGRREIRVATRTTQSNLTNWKGRRRIPATYFDKLEQMAHDKGHVLDRKMFGFYASEDGAAA